ncbi:MAG: hypothetical protein P8Y13_14095 [Deinococcales bacterium]
MRTTRTDPVQLVRHQLAALAYRFQKAIRDAPLEFAAFEPGVGVRTPLAIVHHVVDVLGYLRGVLDGADPGFHHDHAQLDFAGEVAAFHAMLGALDTLLASNGNIPLERLERGLQGPISDALTHVGQLAMLRRLAGSPVRGENFYLADVRVGRTGADQPPPRSPDP